MYNGPMALVLNKVLYCILLYHLWFSTKYTLLQMTCGETSHLTLSSICTHFNTLRKKALGNHSGNMSGKLF